MKQAATQVGALVLSLVVLTNPAFAGIQGATRTGIQPVAELRERLSAALEKLGADAAAEAVLREAGFPPGSFAREDVFAAFPELVANGKLEALEQRMDRAGVSAESPVADLMAVAVEGERYAFAGAVVAGAALLLAALGLSGCAGWVEPGCIIVGEGRKQGVTMFECNGMAARQKYGKHEDFRHFRLTDEGCFLCP